MTRIVVAGTLLAGLAVLAPSASAQPDSPGCPPGFTGVSITPRYYVCVPDLWPQLERLRETIACDPSLPPVC